MAREPSPARRSSDKFQFDTWVTSWMAVVCAAFFSILSINILDAIAIASAITIKIIYIGLLIRNDQPPFGQRTDTIPSEGPRVLYALKSAGVGVLAAFLLSSLPLRSPTSEDVNDFETLFV